MLGANREGGTKLREFLLPGGRLATGRKSQHPRMPAVRSEDESGNERWFRIIDGRGATLQAPSRSARLGRQFRLNHPACWSGILAGAGPSPASWPETSPSAAVLWPRSSSHLKGMGAEKLTPRAADARPLRVTGGRLKAIDYNLPVVPARM